jgi:hypothetical protein
MTRIEIATPLGVGIILGLLAGLVTGMVAGVGGALVGMQAGFVAGMIAGTVMHRDEHRRSARSRELDSIIGVGGGDLGLGAAQVAMPTETPAPAGVSTREQWLAEWLTPPPPMAG